MTYKEKKFCSAMNDDLGIETEENKEDEVKQGRTSYIC